MITAKNGLLILTGMLCFSVIFPTTFWVLLSGPSLINKVLRQMYPVLNFL